MLDTLPADVVTLDPVVAFRQAAPPVAEPRRWSLGTRIAFRFTTLYFGLYNLGATGLMKGLATWSATSLFKVSHPFVTVNTGSGDKTIDWIESFWLLVFAAIGTAVWSALDRNRPNYQWLNKWFRVFLRFAVGSTMVGYGMVKAIPLQMPAPSLQRLVEPFGHFSPMGVLWYSIGASFPYERFAGSMELLGATLLFIPRLSLLGAMVTFATAVQIFTLNMTYDVPVKLFSFHLILMSLTLIVPDAQRLLRVIVLNKTAEPSTAPPLFHRRALVRAAVIVQLALGAFLLGSSFYSARQSWTRYGGGAPKSPLYGIWNVSVMKVDGVERAALIGDYGRWRRLLFSSPTNMSFQRMDDTFQGYGSKIDTTAKSLVLTSGDKESGKFTIQQVDAGRMILDGEMDGHKIYFDLRLYDRNNFLLVTRGFNWIQERPFNK
jgi:hypothetical protein